MARVGVDEAGKGPVLGSMFAAAVRWPDGRPFPDGLADSKRLSRERREALDRELRAAEGARIAVAEVPVRRIDDPATDMNGLTAAAHARAVADVAEPGDAVRGDAADVDPDRYARRLADGLEGGPAGLEITATHRADERHAVVAAASVVAKVARDAHVAELAEQYGDVGSGYPSDPATRAFLERYLAEAGRLPSCARASWATSERALAAAEQADIEEF